MRRRPVLTEEQAAIAAEYALGVSIERLAYKYHRAPQVIRNAIRSQGINTRPPGVPRRIDPDSQTAIIRDYQEGSTLEILAEKYGCSPGTARNILLDHGVVMRSTGTVRGSTTSSCSDVDSAYRQKSRARLRRRVFGWTQEQFDQAWAKQRGLCAICEIGMKRYGRYNESVTVDHDHTTGNPRSLVCQLCNKGLGHFKDSCSILRKAANYLETHQDGL